MFGLFWILFIFVIMFFLIGAGMKEADQKIGMTIMWVISILIICALLFWGDNVDNPSTESFHKPMKVVLEDGSMMRFIILPNKELRTIHIYKEYNDNRIDKMIVKRYKSMRIIRHDAFIPNWIMPWKQKNIFPDDEEYERALQKVKKIIIVDNEDGVS